jgi:hypothetical protein
MSPPCDFVVALPSCDFVVVSPLCDFVVVLPSCDCGFERWLFDVALLRFVWYRLCVIHCLFFHQRSFECAPLHFQGASFFIG